MFDPGCWSTIDMERNDSQHFAVHVDCQSLIIDPENRAK